MIYYLCRGAKYSPKESEKLIYLSDKLIEIYQSKKICRIENNNEKCYHGETGLKNIMKISKNESELRWAWTSWRNEMSDVKKIYLQTINLQNKGSNKNGYKNTGEIWREEMNMINVENLADKLWNDIKNFYQLLHAVVRFKLAKKYPDFIDPIGPIPAHLLNDLWSQNWIGLIDIIFPNSTDTLDITKKLLDKKYTVIDMAKHAEDFYMSIGFPRMTDEFWNNSIMTRVNETNSNCHGTAVNMFEKNDFRIMGCFNVNEEDFHVIHHEMGHVQYYMAYEEQPPIFRNGINSAFQESIGDAISLGVMTPQHLQRLGLASDKILTHDFIILLRQALAKIPQIPYALAMEKWRWRLFEGNINPQNLNDAWWKIYHDFMGIKPQETRHNYFDPTAKFHVVSNTPYIRYFFAYFLQFQIFEGMCKVAITGKIKNDENFYIPLHKCDIYGSKKSGQYAKTVMEMGSSLGVTEALFRLTGSTNYSSESLLKYFEPVVKYLQSEIEHFNIPIGWN
ncbi:angiotensin-converting enzyme-like [Aphidius gifuensis]|nr:angiotensin-converting enzyme-like [Aphidius gifuensis]